MSRRTIIIILTGIGILLVMGLLWFFLRGGAGAPEEKGFIERLVGGGTGLPEAGPEEGKKLLSPPSEIPPGVVLEEGIILAQLTKEPVAGVAVKKAEDKVLYYRRDTGHLFELPFDGQGGGLLSNLAMTGLFDATWNRERNRAIVSIADGDELKQFSLRYVGTTTSGVFLDSSISHARFAPTKDTIAYIIPAGSGFAVVTSLPDGKNKKTLYSTPIADFEVSWISDTLLNLKTKSSALAPSILGTLGLDGTFNLLLGEKEGLDALWAPDEKIFIYSESKEKGRGLTLFLANRASPTQVTELGFVTLPEKCLWSKKETSVLFCAVPKSMPAGILPDGWWRGEISFEDRLWKINVKTGATELLLNESVFDITHLAASAEEDWLFFINKKDSTLWSLHRPKR